MTWRPALPEPPVKTMRLPRLVDAIVEEYMRIESQHLEPLEYRILSYDIVIASR